MLLLAIVALGVPLAINLSGRVKAEVRTQAQAQADLVAATAADMLTPSSHRQLITLARTAAASVRGRILIVDRGGAVLADSAGPAQLGASYESRPEIEAALTGRQVQVQRHSKTLRQEILATAVPIIHEGRPAGAVRVTQSIAAVNGAVHRAEYGLVLLGLIVLGLGLAVGAVIAAQVVRPIRRLEQVARRVASGDHRARAEIEGSREQRSLATSFNEMTGRIAQLLRAQRDFVADASHQLRTPLTGMRLRLEEARELEADENVKHDIDAAIAEVDRLSHTVDELLALSRAGERRLEGAHVQLETLASEACARWQATAVGRGIELEYERAAEAGCAWASPADVERALDVVIDNALQYSPSGTTVTIASSAGSIEVRDRGPGVRRDEREIVFERFHRGSAGKVGPPGSGLGLAIARELMRAWGGEVTIENRHGGGLLAIIRLPSSVSSSQSEARYFARA